MTREDFKRNFMELIKLLFSMPRVYIPPMYVPSGEFIEIMVEDRFYCIVCFRKSMQIYRFACKVMLDQSELTAKLDHIEFLVAYLYNTNKTDSEQRKILNCLKVEVVKQI